MPCRDAAGQTLDDAPRYTGNFSGEYALPVFDTASENTDTANSAYARVGGYGLADLAVGLGRQDRKFDINVIVKNAFDKSYNESPTWASFQ